MKIQGLANKSALGVIRVFTHNTEKLTTQTFKKIFLYGESVQYIETFCGTHKPNQESTNICIVRSPINARRYYDLQGSDATHKNCNILPNIYEWSRINKNEKT